MAEECITEAVIEVLARHSFSQLVEAAALVVGKAAVALVDLAEVVLEAAAPEEAGKIVFSLKFLVEV